MSKTILQIAAEFEAQHIEQYPDIEIGLATELWKQGINYSPMLRLHSEADVYVVPTEAGYSYTEFEKHTLHYSDTFSVNPAIIGYFYDVDDFEKALNRLFEFAKQDL